MEWLPFKVWYCAEFPITEIKIRNSDKHQWPGVAEFRLKLAENIARYGLVNPLIVLNHPRSKCPHYHLQVGTNRLWALLHLGWTKAPAIVTGECMYPSILVDPKDLESYFKDGYPEESPYGIHLRGTKKPELFEYPDIKGTKKPT